MKKMLFIFNPRSGKAQIGGYLAEILDIFTKGGFDVTAHPTQCENDAYNYVCNNMLSYDMLVVSGGDGTLNEAVRGMMSFPKEHRKNIGYIPTGSTNDFASNIGISKDILAAAHTVIDGNERICDIGLFNGRTFNYVAAFGAFTDISYETPQEIKNIFGHGAYVMEGIKKLASIETVHVRFKSGDVVREGNYVVCMVLNSTHIAGVDLNGYYAVDINDGEFEAALIEMPESLKKLNQAITAVMHGKTTGPGFEVIRVKSVIIDTDKPVKWTLDGEFGGETSHAEIKVINGAVSFTGKGEN